MIQHEHAFETEICEWLAGQGWAYRGQLPFDEHYDKAAALYLPDLHGWLYGTQPERLAKITKPGPPASPVEQVLGEYASAGCAPSIIEELEDIPYRADLGHHAGIKHLVTSSKYRPLAEALLAQGLYEALRHAAQEGEPEAEFPSERARS